MKKIAFIIVLIGFNSLISNAQLFVDTLSHNKNVLIEEFTGVQCNSCPQGHIEISNLLAAYPHKVFAAGMHSYSTGHTAPYPGDQDLRRKFPDLLRTKISDLGGIPSGILSRRTYNGKEAFIFWPFTAYHHPIDSNINVVMSENSPFNIGIKADYDTIKKILSINTQVYSTKDTTGTYKLNVYFTESNIIVDQLNGSTVIPDYNEKHVFREILTPTWGADLIVFGTKKRDVYNTPFTFKNDSGYNMKNVEVIAFVTDHTSTSNDKGYVVQVMGVEVKLTGVTSISSNEKLYLDDVQIYPNPSSDMIYIHFNNPSINNEIIISDVNGRIVFKQQTSKENTINLNTKLNPGVYFLSIKNNSGFVKKIMIN